MKFTDYLYEESKELWEGYLKHPFINGIGTGDLDKEKFKKYLIQDYLYLKEYAKVFAAALVKCKSMEDMKFYYNAIGGCLEDETAVHIKYLEGFGINLEELEKSIEELINSSYSSYMQGIALKGNLKEIAMAVMPCTWSYYYIGCYLKDKYNDNLEQNFYKDWIEEYSSDEFNYAVQSWKSYIDKICVDISNNEKEELLQIFINSSKHEMNFWDMANSFN
ncbi:thiaminase II [Clostridium sp.]|uniref:thiaminase II n=1 Tax=Clostridium sp. TaxID=1506 RepID=UPI003F33668E